MPKIRRDGGKLTASWAGMPVSWASSMRALMAKAPKCQPVALGRGEDERQQQVHQHREQGVGDQGGDVPGHQEVQRQPQDSHVGGGDEQRKAPGLGGFE